MKTKRAPGKQAAQSAPGAAELLLEIGSEELPYQFIQPALAQLKEFAEELLKEHRLAYEHLRTVGTPRRLTLVADGLSAHQASTTKEVMGPPKAAALDQAGQPTKAALGFAAGQGVAPEDLQVRRTPKGEYLFAVKHEAGRPTKALLVDLLPQLIAKLSFPKAMKWNDTGVRFARPVRWLVALYGGAVVPTEVAGVKAGNRTYGHRTLGGGKPITVRDYNTYVRALERHGVLPDPNRRRAVIEDQLNQLCSAAGVGLNADEELLEQAVFTTECPVAILGAFKSDYLAVPPEILVTSMKEHQGFFSVRDKKGGSLAAHFVAVANNKPKVLSRIREGNERVLAARLADAKFFYNEDRKIRLEERAKNLSQVTFHQKLGTMAQKTDRVMELAGKLAEIRQDHMLVAHCRRAAQLSKADLLTGIVGEFPTLQGIMGGEYARHDGEPEAVCRAIREQYLPPSTEGPLPKSLEGKILSLADRLDTIVGFFHVGIIPTGSEDPFALRRHATAVVRIIVDLDWLLDLNQWVAAAQDLLKKQGVAPGSPSSGVNKEAVDNPVSFIAERLRFYGRTAHNLRDDVMDAVLKSATRGPFDLVTFLEKMKALQAITSRAEFDPLIVGFKRAHRLTEKEQWARTAVDSTLFQHRAEAELHKRVQDGKERCDRLLRYRKYGEALELLVALKPTIDGFFGAVMVNAEDPAVRGNRLSLLKEVDDLFLSFADFSRILVQNQ